MTTNKQQRIARNLEKATEIIRSFEGICDGNPATVNLDPYLCPAGYWTIGWGHVVTDHAGRQIRGKGNKSLALSIYPSGITMTAAGVLLSDDIRKFSAGVESLLKINISDTKFCALVSFAFNVGIGALSRSTLLRVINEGRFNEAPTQFIRWTKVGGKELSGLKRRRAAEASLWEEGD